MPTEPKPIRLEVLTVEVRGEPRYGVMAVYRHKTGLSYVVYYGDKQQGGNHHDWKTTPEEEHNMKVMAEALLLLLANS